MPTKEDIEKLITKIREVQAELKPLGAQNVDYINFDKSSFDELAQYLSDLEDQLFRCKRVNGIVPPKSSGQKLMTREWQEYVWQRRDTGKSFWKYPGAAARK